MKPFVEGVTGEMARHAGGGNQTKLLYLLVLWFYSEVQWTVIEKLVPCKSKWRSLAAWVDSRTADTGR